MRHPRYLVPLSPILSSVFHTDDITEPLKPQQKNNNYLHFHQNSAIIDN